MDDVFAMLERFDSPTSYGGSKTAPALARILADPALRAEAERRYAFLIAMGIELEDFGDAYRQLPATAEEALARIEDVGRVHPIALSLAWLRNVGFYRYTSLSLAAQERAELPVALSLFTQLRSLDLSGNHFADLELPQRLAGTLLRLDLSDNRFAHLPDAVCGLVGLAVVDAVERGLESLDLSGNLLTDLPRGIGKLRRHLRTLRLDRNRFEEFPVALLQLRTLQDGEWVGIEELSLASNGLGTLPKEIAKLRSLRRLSLARNQLDDVPAALAELPLQTLDLSGNPLRTFPAGLVAKKNPSLEILRLAETGIAELPASIARLSKLRELDLRGCPLSTLPAAITKLRHLALLDVRQTPLRALPPGLERNGLAILR